MSLADPAWLAAGRKDVGLKEIVGSKHERRVVAYFAACGSPWVKDDETPWCAAFVGAKLAEAQIKGTGKLNARSYLDWGQPLKSPAPGAIMVFKRGSSSWEGHVAFFLRDLGTHYEVLGGNQSNAVTIARYPKSACIGMRWPAGFALPMGGAAKPSVVANIELQLGSRGAAVEDWQRGLNALGAEPQIRVDGDFGKATREATLAFQNDRQLPPDAVVNAPDWLALDNALAQLG